MDSTAPRRRLATRGARVLALGAIFVLTVGYGGVSLYTADVLTRPSNRPPQVAPAALGPDATAWSALTADGLTLRGWYLSTPGRRNLVVLVHGMRDSWDRVADVGRDLHREGYDVLLFDLRGHGQSDPSRLFMGRRERADLRAVLGWARQRGFAPDRIGWVGYSMGAATLLMEGARNLAFRAVVLDSPFGNLPELLDAQLTRHSQLPRLFNPGILLAARLAFGVRTDDLVPLRFAPAWRGRPMLLIHGEADEIVPVRQARALARAAGPSCAAITLPGVRHVRAYRADRRGYVARLDQFFDEHLRP